ncbi:Outer membrane efflux protein BepC precursor [Roseovarius sp. THAF27]|nr:Outer membrane efflux protein BepC precursor [Roseovarius sp. THAF27]
MTCGAQVTAGRGRVSKGRALSSIRACLLAGAVAVAGMTGLAGAAKSETLGEALAWAYEYSGLLEQNRALLRAADEDVAQAVSQLRPIINWTADITRDFGKAKTSGLINPVRSTNFNTGIVLELLLFDFGQTRFRIDAAKETVLATRESLRSIEQQVLLRAVAAFYNVQRNREFVSLRQNNLRLLRQELRAARDRFEVGEVTRTDVAQAEARVASTEGELAEAQGNLAQAVEEYRAVVGRTPGTLRTPGGLPNLSAGIEASKNIAARNHPDILQAQRQVASADLTILAADAAMKPRFTAQGRLGVGEDLDSSDYTRSGSVGLNMQAPIYQGGLLSSAKRQAQAQRDAARGNLHVVRRAVIQDVGNAFAILQSARVVREASREQVRAAQVAFRGVREEATLGARTTLDVLNAEQELLNARSNLISADVDVAVAAYQVLSAIGQLTAKDLKLNVQTYDPAAYYNLVKDAPVPISRQGKQLDRVLKSLGRQ